MICDSNEDDKSDDERCPFEIVGLDQILAGYKPIPHY